MNTQISSKFIAASAMIISNFCSSLSVFSQVTIGSSKQPESGALLMLSDKPTDSSNANASAGLGLPRVQLTSYNNLFPMFSDDGSGGYKIDTTAYTKTEEDKAHTGLVVYHMMSATDICEQMPSGLYVWDGSKWNRVPAKQEIKERPSFEYPMTTMTGLDQPNSYIADKAGVIKIPIEKAFKIWDGGSWKGDVNAGDATLHAVLPTSAKDLASMELEAKLLWSDDQCGQLILNYNNLEIKGPENNPYIEVWVGDKKGNAVIALVDKNNNNPRTHALWSWHIWATDMPTIISYNGLTWFDRNLGATSSTVADAKTIGLHYQWGRKDPFPVSADWAGTPLTIYAADGNSIDYNNISHMTQAGDVPEINLSTSITHPISFITSTDTERGDWYNIVSTTSWHDRWDGSKVKKSPSDPCPEGWRVPNGSGGTTSYPWHYSTTAWPTLSLVKGGTWNLGLNWSIAPDNGGYYPASGFRSLNSGVVGEVGVAGYAWSATPAINGYANDLVLSRDFVNNESHRSQRAFGFPVRCVSVSSSN